MANKIGLVKDRRVQAGAKKQIDKSCMLKSSFMKVSYFVISILLLLSLTSSGQIRSNKNLIGKWTASGLKLEFIPDGRVLFTMRGGSIPGARYKTDFLQAPALLVIELQDKQKKIVYRSSIEFIDDDTFRMTTLDNDPAYAFDKQRSVILRREGE